MKVVVGCWYPFLYDCNVCVFEYVFVEFLLFGKLKRERAAIKGTKDTWFPRSRESFLDSDIRKTRPVGFMASSSLEAVKTSSESGKDDMALALTME